METPEGIKKRLEHNADFIEKTVGITPASSAIRDALEYIEWLEKNLQYTVDAAEVLRAESAKFERERDAALRDWKRARLKGEAMCWTCKFVEDGSPCLSPVFCDDGECWQWRGVCLENTEVQEDG